MAPPNYRLRAPDFRIGRNQPLRLGQFRLRLDPWIEWQIRLAQIKRLLDPKQIRLALLRSQPDPTQIFFLDLRNRPITPRQDPRPSRGPGPETPRPARWGELFDAVMKVPEVEQLTTRVKNDAVSRLDHEWGRLRVSERALLIGTGLTMVGMGIGGVLGTETRRHEVLNLAANRDLNIPGVPVGGRLNTTTGPSGEPQVQSVSLSLRNVRVGNIPGLTMQLQTTFTSEGPQLNRFMLNLDVTRLFPVLR